MKTFFGYGWAMPVVNHRSAVWCSILAKISKICRHRILSHCKHMAWERAVGVS